MASSDPLAIEGASIALAHLLNCSTSALRTAIETNVFERVFFLSREGLILYKAFLKRFDNICQSNCRYILASRRALAVSACHDLSDLLALAKVPFNPQTVRLFFLNRFGVDFGEKYSNKKISRHDWPFIRQLIQENEEVLLLSARRERLAYVGYLKSKGLKREGKYLLVDVGYNGSIHRAFEKIFPEIEFYSFYIATFTGADSLVKKGRIFSVFPGVRDNRLRYDFFSRNVALIELLLMAQHGSFLSIVTDDSGRRKFILDTSGCYRFLGAIQERALEELPRLGACFSSLDSARYFENWVSNPPGSDVIEFVGANLDDRYGGKIRRPLLDIESLPVKGSLSFSAACNFVSRSDWRDGALSLIAERNIDVPRYHKLATIFSIGKAVKKAFISDIAFREFVQNFVLRMRGVYLKPRTVADDVLCLIYKRSHR